LPDKQALQNDNSFELVFVIVRLVYSPVEGLHHGELVSASGELLSRFRSLEELPALIAQAIKR
jgi:hypothetical protein